METDYMGVVEMPMRHALERFVGERVGLDFILNTVLNGHSALVHAVAGHCIQAHRAGVQRGQAVFGTPVTRRHQLVVCNSFPTDHDLWQSTKALRTGDLLTADGGTLILLTACREGVTGHLACSDLAYDDLASLTSEVLLLPRLARGARRRGNGKRNGAHSPAAPWCRCRTHSWVSRRQRSNP